MALKIVAAGEVLWDLLPSGRQMGGAPANFACHARALGAEARLISRVGDDELGREILRRMERHGVGVDTVGIDRQWPTGTVSVELAPDGQPRFTINPDAAWDHLQADPEGLRVAAQCDAICFGTLVQRSPQSRSAIRELLAAVPAGSLRVLDINLRPPFVYDEVIRESLRAASVLKLNDQELPVLASIEGLAAAPPAEQLAELARRFSLRLVALTRGGAGSLLYSGGRTSEHAGLRVEVVDAVGAGDAFTAAIVMGHLHGRDLDQINEHANRVAAFVCTQPGATPELPEKVKSVLSTEY